MGKCEEIFGQMPDDFPPKRVMCSLEEIREQNTRILRHLEQEEHRRTTQAAGA